MEQRQSGHGISRKTLFGAIGSMWRGEYPLWFQVWIAGAGMALLMVIFWSGLGRAVATPGTPLHSFVLSIGVGKWMTLTSPLFGLCSIYMCMAMIGIWRSARRYKGPTVWRWAAWLAALGGLYLLVRVVLSVAVTLLFGT